MAKEGRSLPNCTPGVSMSPTRYTSLLVRSVCVCLAIAISVGCGDNHARPAFSDTSHAAREGATASTAALKGTAAGPLQSVDARVGVLVGGVTIWLDSTKLETAVRILGAGQDILRRVGEGAAVVACFRAAATADTAYLALTSHDGDAGRVITATISREMPEQSYLRSCTPLATTPDHVGTTIGLRLGMPRTEVERLLGRPLREEPTVTWYSVHSAGQPLGNASSADLQGDRTSYYAMKYRKGVLVSATIHRGNDIISDIMKG